MKKLYKLKRALFSIAAVIASTQLVQGQVAVTCTPGMSQGCGAGDYIDSFVLNGISATGNAGCNGGTNSYTNYPTPVWNLLAGQTYTWAITHGSWAQCVSIWIDLNNDGFYTSTEQMANITTPALAHSGSFLVPLTATGGSPVKMRVRCRWNSPFGTGNNEACAGYSYGETEDYNVNVIPPTPCSSAPASNTVVVPNFSICPNSGTALSLATSYTETGITYQWYTSTQSSLGIYSPVTTGTTASIPSGPLTQNTWYQVVITCTNAGPTSTVGATSLVMVSPVIIDSVPYHEGFEGIVSNNMLPNCSWSATSLPSITQTYTLNSNYNRVPHSGNKFASFRYGTGSSGQYFYSNGIYLQAGITYSAGTWYIADGLLGWQEFSLYYNTAQSSIGLTTIATKTGAVTNTNYQLLSDTFSVPTDGVYYLAVMARDNGSPWYLTWDDLFVVIPCDLNSPTVSIQPSATLTCEGEVIQVTANGANDYLWSNGSTSGSTSFTATPSLAQSGIGVVGTRSLGGCSNSASVNIVVNPNPDMAIVPSAVSVCPGTSAVLVALGASTYTWDDLSSNPVRTVKPNASMTFTVKGSNSFGCMDEVSYMLTVHPQPTLSTSNSQTMICVGDTARLEASGAASYQWMANTAFIQDNPIYVSPLSTTIYTLVGTDINGCTASAAVNLFVDPCTGLNAALSTSLRIYPNPTSGTIRIIRDTQLPVQIKITDITGRQVFTKNAEAAEVLVDLSEFAKGVYYIQILGENGSHTERIIKN